MAKKKHNRRQDHGKKATLKAAASPPGPRERREVITRNPAPDLDLRPKTKWFLVYTSPRGEARALAGLQEAGCATFWPSHHKIVTVGKRTTFDSDVATFPRYLFASGRILDGQGDPQKPVVKGRPINSVFDIDCIQDIVCDRTGWLRVPNAAIATIADFQNRMESTEPTKPVARVNCGDVATIISGPFMSFQATVVEALGLHDAKVLIDIFGGKVPATIGLSSLRAA